MSNYTEHYNLKKPLKTESYDVDVANTNNDIIDEKLYGKVDKVPGKGLSENDFTDGYKKKVDNLVEGIKGDSAYQIAVQNGFEGSEKDWLASLKGKDGNQGIQGEKGKSNILTIGTVEKGEEASASITGETPNQILNLVLPKGNKGEKGDTGEKGSTPIKGTDYFTEQEIKEIKNSILSQVNQFNIQVVQQLPTGKIDTHTIYFVPKASQKQNDIYEEYIYINNSWEHIGTLETNLSDYYTKDEINDKISNIVSLPAGGAVGQILTKKGSDDYNVKWGNLPTIVDNLTSTSTTMALSANQGKVLNDKISNLPSLPTGGTTGQILAKKSNTDYDTQWQNPIPIIDNLESTDTTSALSAKQGKALNDTMTSQGNRINALEDKSAHVLYTNESGSRNDITLSDDVSNYSYIKIYYRNDINIINSQEFINCNDKDISLFMAANRPESQASWLQISRRHVSGNKITVVYSTEIKITNAGAVSVGTGNYIFITKIEGFK